MRYPSFNATTAVHWLATPAGNAAHVKLRGVATGEQADLPGAALLLVEFSRPVSRFELQQTGLMLSERFGPFAYISRPPQPQNEFFEIRFQVPAGVSLARLGIRSFDSVQPLAISELEISVEAANDAFGIDDSEILINVSIDTEALPGRATVDHVERLIYGRLADGDRGYGLPLHFDVYREFDIPASFYLECAQAAMWGDDAVIDAGRLIVDEGFDLQLHLHAEVLARAQRWPWASALPPYLDRLNHDQTRRTFEFGLDRFRQITGRHPQVFRAGGYRYGPTTLDVGAEMGIKAFSNYRADQRAGNAFDFPGMSPMRPFRWSNGIDEFTITLSPEPLSALSAEECWKRVMHHATVNKSRIVTIVVHSWSFMKRTPQGHHEWAGPDLVDNLRRFFAQTPAGVRYMSASQLVENLASGAITMPIVKEVSDLVSTEQVAA